MKLVCATGRPGNDRGERSLRAAGSERTADSRTSRRDYPERCQQQTPRPRSPFRLRDQRIEGEGQTRNVIPGRYPRDAGGRT